MPHLQRRDFLTATAATAAMGFSSRASQAAGDEPDAEREYYELRKYTFDSDEQRDRFNAFMAEALVPALNRLGVEPVGLFHKPDEDRPAFVLLPHASLESMATLTGRLLADEQFRSQGAELLDTTSDRPAFSRINSSLFAAFKGMPKLETPIKSAGRVLQLRTYESHSVLAGQKKIEMFNDAGEIPIFRDSGLHPVFFGEALVGPKLPNLTYMLAFESEQQLEENWQTFINHPEWKKISVLPEYANERILSNITNRVLKPAECSQI